MPKYKIKKEALKYVYSSIEMALHGNYHNFYITHCGCVRGSNGNFHCPQPEAHSGGTDNNPSMSIDNDTGLWKCWGCGIHGNLASYYKEFIGQNDIEHEGSFTSFVIDMLGIAGQMGLDKNDPNDEKHKEQIKKLYESLNSQYLKKHGKTHVLSKDAQRKVKEATVIDKEINNVLVNRLLNDDDKLEYLKRKRNIREDIIEKYRIGLTEHGAFTFPIFSTTGDLLNIKEYNPFADPSRKWKTMFKGNPVLPSPINHFTQSRIDVFEGEPDMYCMIGFGLDTAVTMGSASNKDVVKIFGYEMAKQLFSGKEINITMDSDEAGRRSAVQIARSVYPFAKQVKIIDLDKSPINPNGLTDEEKITVDGKEKRKHKDATDFLEVNGFNDNAFNAYLELVNNTKAYTEDIDRKTKKTFKVTVQEARSSDYFSSDGTIELEMIASVSNMDCDSHKYPTRFSASCSRMGHEGKLPAVCKRCILSSFPEFDTDPSVILNVVREYTKETLGDPHYIKIDEHNILGLIEVADNQRLKQLKTVSRISPNCNDVIITYLSINGLTKVRLVSDIDSKPTNGGSTEVDITAYMLEKDVYPNKSYKFKAVQTTSWNGQYAVLFIHDAQPIATAIDTFVMDQDVHDVLCKFKPFEGESIDACLKRKYDIFANASGINKRRDMFFINDLAYFSAIEINNKRILPSIKRGWVEVLIAGDSRCGKTVISKFLNRRYKVGEVLGGSSAVTRSGLLGGIDYFKNKPKINWGKMVSNDGRIVIIDELSSIDQKTFDDLTELRSEGEANITLIKSGKAPARVRKIMLSNQRAWHIENSANSYAHGIHMLRHLCFKDSILSRFDVAYVVRADDVDKEEFTASYESESTDFTEYQCQALIRWAYSRTADDIVFEDGLEDCVNNSQKRLLEKYHPATQLVNQEMRAKLIRLSVSLATMLYSTPEDDCNKIYVKSEHVEYIVDFLDRIYSSEKMALDKYSSQIRKSESLGDMRFMMNILRYTDINLLMRYEEFRDKDLYPIFADYFAKVAKRELWTIDAVTGEVSNGMRPSELLPKFIGLLMSRNCITQVKGKYKKTENFNKWLVKRLEDGNHAEQSDILEYSVSESDRENIKKLSSNTELGRRNARLQVARYEE